MVVLIRLTAVLTVISGNHGHIIMLMADTDKMSCVASFYISKRCQSCHSAPIWCYYYQCIKQTATELIILACWGLIVIVISSTWHDILASLIQDGVNDKLTGCPTLEDLGVELTPLEVAARFYTKSYRPNRYYLDSIGEISHAVEPISASEIEASKKVYYWFSHWL